MVGLAWASVAGALLWGVGGLLWVVAVLATALWAVVGIPAVVRVSAHAVRMRGADPAEVRCRMALLSDRTRSVRDLARRYRRDGGIARDYAVEPVVGGLLFLVPLAVVVGVGAAAAGRDPVVVSAAATALAGGTGVAWGVRSVRDEERRLRDPAERYDLAERYAGWILAGSDPLFPWPVGPEADVPDDAEDPGAAYADAAADWAPTDPEWTTLWDERPSDDAEG